MYKKWTLIVAGLFIGLAAACGSFNGETETREDTFVVGGSPSLVVNNDNGRVAVKAGSDSSVTVKAILRNPNRVEYEISQVGGAIIIEAKSDSRGVFDFGESPGVDLEITAPSSTMLELLTSNGDVDVHGLHKSGVVRTSNGAIVAADVVGVFELSTSNGKVTVDQSEGTFNIESSNGQIDFEAELTANGNNRLSTSNGSVAIKLLGTPNLKLDVSTGNGSIKTDLPIRLTSELDERHVIGTIGDRDAELAELFVRTSNGSVQIK